VYWAQSGLITWVTISSALVQMFIDTVKVSRTCLQEKEEQPECNNTTNKIFPWWLIALCRLAFAIIQNAIVAIVISYDKYDTMPCPLWCGEKICQGQFGITLGFWLLLILSKASIEDLGCRTKKNIEIAVKIFSMLVEIAADVLVIFWPILQCQSEPKKYNSWEIYIVSIPIAGGFLFTQILLRYFSKSLRAFYVSIIFLISLVGAYLVATQAPLLPIFGRDIGIISGVAALLIPVMKIFETCQNIYLD
ncbi:22315_t:CDS:1, partial [Cetraspora pellucida]